MAKSTVTIQVTYPDGATGSGIALDDPPLTADASLRLTLCVADPLWGCHFRGFDENDWRYNRLRLNARLREWGCVP